MARWRTLGDSPGVTSAPKDELGNGFIAVVEKAEHGGKLTRELLEQTTENFTKVAVYKNMVPFPPEITERAYYDAIAPEQNTVWRKQREGVGVDMADRYDYVTGEEGTAGEFIEQVFSGNVGTYAFLGPMAYGLAEQKGEPSWGSKLFRKIRAEIFRTPWLDMPPWRMTGQAFFGSCTAQFGEVSEGHPGSDWHSAASLNLFVMVAGLRKWMSFPPGEGEQLGKKATRIEGALRVDPADASTYDTVHLHPGDVLFNPPFEWHKILNARGLTCGMAFRLKDVEYVSELVEHHLKGAALELGTDERIQEVTRGYFTSIAARDDLEGEDGIVHLLTSAMYASLDPRRAKMLLGIVELNIMQMALSGLMQQAAESEA